MIWTIMSEETATYRYDTWDFRLTFVVAVIGIAATAILLILLALDQQWSSPQIAFVSLALLAAFCFVFAYGRGRWQKRLVLTADRIRLLGPGRRTLVDKSTVNIHSLLRTTSGERTVTWAILFFSGESIEFFPGVVDAEAFATAVPRLTGKKWVDADYEPPVEFRCD